MNTDTNQIALLIATVQQLSSKIDKMEANQLPRHQWLSSSEIAVAVGVTNRTIQNWMKEGKKFKKFVKQENKKQGNNFMYKNMLWV